MQYVAWMDVFLQDRQTVVYNASAEYLGRVVRVAVGNNNASDYGCKIPVTAIT